MLPAVAPHRPKRVSASPAGQRVGHWISLTGDVTMHDARYRTRNASEVPWPIRIDDRPGGRPSQTRGRRRPQRAACSEPSPAGRRTTRASRRWCSSWTARTSSPGIERLRRWALEQLAMAPGETVVDVGSGSGTMTRRLATLVATGGRRSAWSPTRHCARSRPSASTGEASAEFLDGLAGHLPFDDGTVDWSGANESCSTSTTRPVPSARSPGCSGRAVVPSLIDADHATRIVAGIRPETEAAIADVLPGLSPNARSAREIPTQVSPPGWTSTATSVPALWFSRWTA